MKNMMKFVVCAVAFLLVSGSANSTETMTKQFRIWQMDALGGQAYDILSAAGQELYLPTWKCSPATDLGGNTTETWKVKIQPVSSQDGKLPAGSVAAVAQVAVGPYAGGGGQCNSQLLGVGTGVAIYGATNRVLVVGVSAGDNPMMPLGLFNGKASIAAFNLTTGAQIYRKDFPAVDAQGYGLDANLSQIGPFSGLGGDDEIRVVYTKTVDGMCAPVCGIASFSYKTTYYRVQDGTRLRPVAAGTSFVNNPALP